MFLPGDLHILLVAYIDQGAGQVISIPEMRVGSIG